VSFYAWPYPPPPEEQIVDVGILGDRFTINGKIQHIRGFTDFAGLDIFRRTGTLSPLALQMQQVHHDFVSLSKPVLTPRILLMKNKGSLFDLDPREIPDYFSKLDHHAMLMTQQNFLPLYVLLADCAANGMSLGYQQQFVGQACDVLRHHVCLVELVNEYNNGPQQVDPLAFAKPHGVCISRGSPTDGGAFPWPGWDWSAPHTRRDDKWLTAVAKDAWSYRAGLWPGNEAVTHPILPTEDRGAGDVESGSRYTSTRDAFDLGAMHAMWYHGGVFHSEAGLRSQVLSPGQLNCAICYWRGMFAIPEVP